MLDWLKKFSRFDHGLPSHDCIVHDYQEFPHNGVSPGRAAPRAAGNPGMMTDRTDVHTPAVASRRQGTRRQGAEGQPDEEGLPASFYRHLPVLVTGATGKLGRHLVQALLAREARVAILTRSTARARTLWPGADLAYRQADLQDPATLGPALEGIALVFHLASYAPLPGEAAIYEAPAHWTVSATGTRHLVAAALAAGVRRLVYVSSVKVMGEAAGAGSQPATEATVPAPDTLYGRAKLAAEGEVLAAGGTPGVHASVLRLPMVYGLAGQGNLARMIAAVAGHRFPPWPRHDNRRSAIHVEDAVRAALLCAGHPRAAGQVFLVTDGAPYSTRWLYERIRLALGRRVPSWGIPLAVLKTLAAMGSLGEKVTGRAMPLTLSSLDKLTGNAWYSAAKIGRELGFQARHNLDETIPLLVGQVRKARADVQGGTAVPD